MFFCCDGAKSNRRFFQLHSHSLEEPAYKVLNPFANEERYIYFISDPPHLVKTLRNCLANSGAHKRTRNMWVSIPIIMGFCVLSTLFIRLNRCDEILKYNSIEFAE